MSSTASAALYLVEVNASSGAVIQRLALPSVTVGEQFACTREASHQVGISLSSDGTMALLACYDAPVGTVNPWIVPSSSPAFHRVIARVYADGAIDSSVSVDWAPFSTSVSFAYGVNGATSAGPSAGIYVAGQDYTSQTR